MNEDRFTLTPADWGFDRYAPANATALELRYVINAVLTNCRCAGRRMLDGSGAVPQTLQFEGTHRIAADTCAKGTAYRSCATKTCLWTANPTQALVAPDARCYPKITVGHWACMRQHPGRPRLRAQPGLHARRQQVCAQAQQARHHGQAHDDQGAERGGAHHGQADAQAHHGAPTKLPTMPNTAMPTIAKKNG
jgi:hypothetical protein